MSRDRPQSLGNPVLGWGSDAIAEMLRRLDLRYACLTPGASFRGLHDSIVNYLGNETPEMIVTLHEEHAVAIAHGYAKVTETPIAVIVHSNVGLMHATMAIFNAWCDRVPIVVLGATGPVDAARRRPWIDWIHTASDQGALVRSFTKWDDQPASVPAALESLLRARQYAATAPCGPVYVCLDAALQESALDSIPDFPDPARFAPPPPPAPSAQSLDRAARLLAGARRPVMLAGRVSRSQADWGRRVALAESLQAPVLADFKVGAAFPTTHPLHLPPLAWGLSEAGAAALREVDVILSLDWVDLGGTFKLAFGEAPVSATVIGCSLDSYSHRGWSMDYQALPPVDLPILAAPDGMVAALLERIGADSGRAATADGIAAPRQRNRAGPAPRPPPAPTRSDTNGAIRVRDIAHALERVRGDREICLSLVPGSWPGDACNFRAPLDYLGRDGGAGLGSDPGIAVGAALALNGSGRLAVAVLGDGDYLMGATALWTAARMRLPLLVIVANNRRYGNDEVHQEHMAKMRNRPVANKWIGQRIDDPPPDLVGLAKAQGLDGEGPIETLDSLSGALETGLAAVESGAGYVLDILTLPD